MRSGDIVMTKASGRVLTLEYLIGNGRWFCTDNIDRCHPCHNESDLYVIQSSWERSLARNYSIP